jgi:hypothetical protein
VLATVIIHQVQISTHFNDFIAGELKERNVRRIASHKIAIQNPQDTFVCDDKKIGLFSLKLKNDGLQTNGKVVVRLYIRVGIMLFGMFSDQCLPPREDNGGGKGQAHAWQPHPQTPLGCASRTSAHKHQGAVGSTEIFAESCSHCHGGILLFPLFCVGWMSKPLGALIHNQSLLARSLFVSLLLGELVDVPSFSGHSLLPVPKGKHRLCMSLYPMKHQPVFIC